MANTDNPNGFHFVRDTRGTCDPQVVPLDIDSGVSGTIGRGQPCKLDAGGHIVEIDGSTFANDADGNGAGIYIAQQACVAGDTDIPFIPAAHAIFQVQADDDVTWTTRATLQAFLNGTWFGLTNPLAISTDGLNRSTCELDGNDTHATDNYIQIVDWLRAPDQEFGAFQQVLVRWNPRLFEDSPMHVQVNT